MAIEYEPGDKVPCSGIYKVVHDDEHTEEHEVTVIFGKHFPPCNHCGDEVRFVLVRKAKHITNHSDFS